jgi:hypothetical protein
VGQQLVLDFLREQLEFRVDLLMKDDRPDLAAMRKPPQTGLPEHGTLQS